ncbi:hypothetical protein V5O48_016999, partial [Marasmius crinis-equi]
TRMMRTSEIKPNNYDSSIQRGYEVLSSLRSELESKSHEGGDNVIWKVTIKKGSVAGITRLTDAQATRVQKRREDPQKPIERIGIVPEEMITSLRQ